MSGASGGQAADHSAGPSHEQVQDEAVARRKRALQAAKESLHRTLDGEATSGFGGVPSGPSPSGASESAARDGNDQDDREWQRKAAWLREQRPPHWG